MNAAYADVACMRFPDEAGALDSVHEEEASAGVHAIVANRKRAHEHRAKLPEKKRKR